MLPRGVQFRDGGGLVVAVSQCHTGPIILDKYEVGAAVAEAGMVSAGDMTTEATVAKLAFLLGTCASRDEVQCHTFFVLSTALFSVAQF